MNAKSSNVVFTEIQLMTIKLNWLKKQGEMVKAAFLDEKLQKMVKENESYKALSKLEGKVPERVKLRDMFIKPMEKNVTGKTLKEEIVDLLVMCATLPDSKVTGQDMFTRQTLNTGLEGLVEEKFMELALQEGKNYSEAIQEINEEYKDRLQVILDKEDDLYKNAEVDDVNESMMMFEVEFLDDEWKSHESMMNHAWAVSSAALDRHDRMAIRLALTLKDKTVAVTDEDVTSLLDSHERLPVTQKEIAKQDRLILQKNNATFFRKKLEDKAIFLRNVCARAEDMKAGKVKMDWQFVNMVIRLANTTKGWADRKAMGNNNKPYSKRSLNALYNEAIHTLVALGVFKFAQTKKEFNSDVECSFFYKQTAEDMVEVKSGSHWADELRSMFYESDNGTGMTSIRGSGNE